jgi:hypothetical protein
METGKTMGECGDAARAGLPKPLAGRPSTDVRAVLGSTRHIHFSVTTLEPREIYNIYHDKSISKIGHDISFSMR